MILRSFLLVCFILLGGCAGAEKRSAIYPMSYDQTFLVTSTALDNMPSWTIIETDQAHGLIKIENEKYLSPRQEATILVKRIDPFRTKVEIDDTRNMPFQQKILQTIDRYFEERSLTYPS